MKMNQFLPILGLLALTASSPPAFSAPNTGPKVDNIEEVVSISASADQIMPEQGVFQVSITNNYFSTCVQASGQETVLHRSDHSVTGMNVDDFNVNSIFLVGDKSKQLVDGDKYRDEHPQTWFDGRSCTSDMQVNISDKNYKNNVTGLASIAALHPHRMAWVIRRPAWMAVPLRC